MSSLLNQNITVLQELLKKINQLPEAGITPSGTLSITENGTYDFTEYASANVAIENDGFSEEEVQAMIDAALEVIENGTY
jgi:hypothetical protein